jgi:triosephosphate isomerase (TIM)
MSNNSSNRIPVIARNWKMHKTIEEAVSFVHELIPLIQNAQDKVYIAVPYTALRFAADAAKDSPIVIGAENMSDETEGAFTGEISARMLENAGAKFVILGHSERRHIFNESNAFIHRKVKKAISENIQIIFCLGETGQERKAKKTEEVLNQQLEESLGDISAEQMAAIILAYEPVWAIGSGHSALPEEVQAMHHFCRQWVKQKWGEETAQKVIIQYGGSVHPNDAKDFMELPDVDGVLVGGASLTVESFNKIIHYSSVGD